MNHKYFKGINSTRLAILDKDMSTFSGILINIDKQYIIDNPDEVMELIANQQGIWSAALKDISNNDDSEIRKDEHDET